MATRHEDFFHALQEHPEDDALRLVYSDFLEEFGGEPDLARAQLIRVQVELAGLPPLDRRIPDLTARQDDLLARWERVWLGDVAGTLRRWRFRRGLLEAVEADAASFLDHAESWLTRWPTLSVAKITGVGERLGELAASPWLAHLRGLDLSDNGINADALYHLAASPFICLLQALDLSGNPIGDAGSDLLCSAAHADDLCELHLSRCGLGRGELAGLLGRRSRQWRRLDLSRNWIYRTDLEKLVRSPVMPNLTALDLATNPIGEDNAALLATSPDTGNLAHLGLCETRTGNDAVAALAASPHLGNLRSLDLRCHGCTTQLDERGEDRGGIGELSRSPLLGQLRRLLIAWGGWPNGWAADVLAVARPARELPRSKDGWTATLLRRSRHLIPSLLVETDLEDLWWLGDTRGREKLRLPTAWDDPNLET